MLTLLISLIYYQEETVGFNDKLVAASRKNKSLLSIGLDPDPNLMLFGEIFSFNKSIIDATKNLVCAYKPNLAFYEAEGISGLNALNETIQYIKEVAPNIPIIGDAKRGDIDSTNGFYAKAMFEYWDFDAITINAFSGLKSIEPFTEDPNKSILIWCRASNLGAEDLQDVYVSDLKNKIPYFQLIAELANQANRNNNVGVVVGANSPTQLSIVRSICPEMPILIPGVGAQGGDAKASIEAGLDITNHNIIINSSRGIIYAPKTLKTFHDDITNATNDLNSLINMSLKQLGRAWD